MKTKYSILFVLFLSVYSINAQKIFATNEGHIVMMSLVNGENVRADSHNLILTLDYTTKEVKGRLDLRTLLSPNINFKETNNPMEVSFSGVIPVVDFMIPDHEPINFKWMLTITYQGKSYKTLFNATVSHAFNGLGVACLLTADGTMDISMTDIDKTIVGIDNNIQLQFSQLLIRVE